MIRNVKLHRKQGKALKLLREGEKQYILFGGGSEGGKSWLGWFWLISNCYNYEGTRWFCGREELKRLRNTTLQTFFKVVDHYDIPRSDFNYNGQDHFIEFRNGSRIDLLELKYKPADPMFQRFGSSEYTGGWIEEAGEIHYGAFDILKVRIGRHLNKKYDLLPAKMFLTCNPAKNWLYTTFYLPWKNKILDKAYAFIQSLYNDNIYREPGTEEKLDNLADESQKQRLKYGNWEYADDPNALVSFIDLMALKDVERKEGVSVCGADIARYGDDSTTFCKFSGNEYDGIDTITQQDTVQVGKSLIQFMNNQFIPAEKVGIDTVGLGAGVYDYLKEKNKHCVEIISGAKPTKTLKIGDGDRGETYEFKNLRSQMWWQFREDCKNKEIRVNTNDQELLTDLTAPRYKIVNEKMIQVESKDDIKKRLGRSPDKGDAFVYANAMRAGIIKIEEELQADMVNW